MCLYEYKRTEKRKGMKRGGQGRESKGRGSNDFHQNESISIYLTEIRKILTTPGLVAQACIPSILKPEDYKSIINNCLPHDPLVQISEAHNPPTMKQLKF